MNCLNLSEERQQMSSTCLCLQIITAREASQVSICLSIYSIYLLTSPHANRIGGAYVVSLMYTYKSILITELYIANYRHGVLLLEKYIPRRNKSCATSAQHSNWSFTLGLPLLRHQAKLRILNAFNRLENPSKF